MKIVSLRIVLILSVLIGWIIPGLAWAEVSIEPSPANIKVGQWKGQSLTFIDLPNEKRATGYEIFRVDQATKGFEGDFSARVPYVNYVGKEVTVTEVVDFPAGYDRKDYMVYMNVKNTGEKLVGRTTNEQLEGLVLTADLQNARQYFLGKTIYPKFRTLPGLYIADLNQMSEPVSIKIGDPVTVVDIYTGIRSQEPIWLVIMVNGKKGILPITYSWSNIPTHSWKQTPGWQEALFIKNPRELLGGDQELWRKIQDGDIEKGMSKNQIALSWGPPLKNVNDANWIYGTKKLHFNGEILDSIETLTESKH